MSKNLVPLLDCLGKVGAPQHRPPGGRRSEGGEFWQEKGHVDGSSRCPGAKTKPIESKHACGALTIQDGGVNASLNSEHGEGQGKVEVPNLVGVAGLRDMQGDGFAWPFAVHGKQGGTDPRLRRHHGLMADP